MCYLCYYRAIPIPKKRKMSTGICSPEQRLFYAAWSKRDYGFG